MVGRPIFNEISKEAIDLLRKAQNLEQRLDEIEKAEPNYSVAFETTPHDISFESESGGRTRNAHYNTNNHLIESQDMPNKGASSEKVNLDSMPMNERADNSGRLIEG